MNKLITQGYLFGIAIASLSFVSYFSGGFLVRVLTLVCILGLAFTIAIAQKNTLLREVVLDTIGILLLLVIINKVL
jgi:hypothetical protein